MHTPICDELGIEFPIFAFTHCRDVVVAVSKAGGFGVLGAAGLTPDAVPWTGPDDASPALLPEWYMPRPMTGTRASWPVAVAALVITGLLVIDAFGLCITSGFLSWA